MAGELRAGAATGFTLYARITNASSSWWNGSSFETYNAANYSNYVITLTEQGSTGIYVGDRPTGIVDVGSYEAVFYLQDGVSPADGDRIAGTQPFTILAGGATVTSPTIPGALDGADWLEYVLQAFKRTDKNTEIFEATKDVIDDIRTRFVLSDDEKEIQVTDTIATLGEYQLDLETDFGLLIADVYVQISSNYGYPLNKISKREFDEKYSVYGTGSSVRQPPKDYCIYAGKIYIGPVPDSIAYTYKINYGMDTRAAYDSNSSSIPFTNRYRRILRWGVLSYLYSDILKNDDQAAKFGTLFENGLRGIERKDDMNRTGVIQTRYQGI